MQCLANSTLGFDLFRYFVFPKATNQHLEPSHETLSSFVFWCICYLHHGVIECTCLRSNHWHLETNRGHIDLNIRRLEATNIAAKVLTGEYKNQSIGCMSGGGGSYTGSVNKLDEGKTYTGKATVTGNTLKLSGCVLAGIICKTEKLKRQ